MAPKRQECVHIRPGGQEEASPSPAQPPGWEPLRLKDRNEPTMLKTCLPDKGTVVFSLKIL